MMAMGGGDGDGNGVDTITIIHLVVLQFVCILRARNERYDLV